MERDLLPPLRRFAADLAGSAGGRLPGVLFFLFAGALVEGFGILLLVPLLSVVIGAAPTGGWLGAFTAGLIGLVPGASRGGRILFLLGLFALLFALRAAVILRRDVLVAELQTGFVQARRHRLVELLAGARWQGLAGLRHGRVTNVLGREVDEAANAAHLLLQCTVAAAILLGQLTLAFLLSPVLAALVLVLLALAALALRPVLRRARDLGADIARSNLGIATSTSEFLGGLKLAMSQDLQGGFVAELDDILAGAARRRVRFARQRTAAQLALAGAAAAVAGLTLLLGIALLDLAPSAAIAFLFILARMNGPAMQVQAGAQQIFHALPSYAEMKRLEEELEAVQAPASEAPAGPLPEGPFELQGVSYGHGPEGAGVAAVDLRIAPGEFLGIAGPSGAGKTTLADLMVGLYPPQAGAIRIGGAALQGGVLAAWRRSVAYVAQDPFLFHDSVRRNFLWAAPDASEEEMRAALAEVGAGELVERLGGLDAVLGERGALLSGGERQRIALARALLRRPRLLLLDEATSAIDVAGERGLLESLRRALPEAMFVMVAHRAESLALCDRILEMRAGTWVQSLDR